MKVRILIALIVIMGFVACNNNTNNDVPPREEVVYVDNLIEQGKDFDTETLIQGLPGVWKTDTVLRYDDNWQDLLKVDRYKGNGGIWEQYTFMADGTGQYCSPGALDDLVIFDIDWQYDVENKNLIIALHYTDGYIEEVLDMQWKIIAFSDEYLVFDDGSFVTQPQNMRCVYKRVTAN